MHVAVQHVEAIGGQMQNSLKGLVRMPTVHPPGGHDEGCRRESGMPSLAHGPGTTGTAHTPHEHIVIDDRTRTTQVLGLVALTLLR